MKFSEYLTGPMLTTDQWLAQHHPCLQRGETFTTTAYTDTWFSITCLCGARHLCHDDERPALAHHPALPGLLFKPLS